MKLVHKIRIVDRQWLVYIYEPKEWHDKNIKKYGEVIYGLTHMHRRVIELPVSANHEDIRHELWHAFSYELCLLSAPHSKKAWDEIMCDFFAKYGKTFLRLSAQLERIFRIHNRQYRRAHK